MHIKQESAWQLLLQFVSPEGSAGEQQSVKRVTEAGQELGLPTPQMERIRKALMEALRRTTKLGHHDQPDLPVTVRIWISDDHTAERSRFSSNDERGGRQEHRGWGFFLIQKQEGNPQASAEGMHHLVELFLYQERVLAKERGREDRDNAGTSLC